MPNITFVPASMQRIEIPDVNAREENVILKHLEAIGRTCYKSEDKITDTSAQKFIDNLRTRKHWAMLEHFMFCLEIDPADYEWLQDYLPSSDYDSEIAQKMKFINLSVHQSGVTHYCDDQKQYLVSGSPTAFNYLLEAVAHADPDSGKKFGENNQNAVFRIMEFMHSIYPSLFNAPGTKRDLKVAPGHCADKKDLRLLSHDEVCALPVNLRRIHDFMTFRLITDRGVTHEEVRHRPMSFAQESTRYCNYGTKGYQFILPPWFHEEEKQTLMDPDKVKEIISIGEGAIEKFDLKPSTYDWVMHKYACAVQYEKQLSHGWTAQMARCELPHSTKVDIVMTANLAEWEHYFKMRVPSTAHPQMYELARPMLLEAANYDYEIFSPLVRELMLKNSED